MDKMCRRTFLASLLFIAASIAATAQQRWSFTYYTIADGLPSNAIYRCVQDKKGFLWIATENGLSRFDGQHFTNFTTKDGLPDNEIIDLFTDDGDNVWVTPFTRFPAYFDAVQCKIINHEINPELARLKTNNVMFGNALSNGDVAIYNRTECHILRKGKVINAYLDLKRSFVYVKKSGNGEVVISMDSLLYYKNGFMQKRVVLPTGSIYFIKIAENNNQLLYTTHDASSIVQLTGLHADLSPTVQKKKFPFSIFSISYLPHYIGLVTANGVVYLLDKSTFEIKDSIITSYTVRSLFGDPEGNIWICTGDKGLIKARRPHIVTLPAPRAIQENKLAITVDKPGIAAGDFQGNILYFACGRSSVTNILGNEIRSNNIVIKKIIHYKDEEYVVSQAGVFTRNRGHSTFSRHKDLARSAYKDAVVFNDSMLLTGTSDHAYVYNLAAHQFIDSIKKRVTVVGAGLSGTIYVGSVDGLYKWENKSLYYYGDGRKALTYRIASLCPMPDSIVWVGLAADSLVALRNDTVLASISLGAVATGTICKSLAGNKPGELWLGTDASLNRINYSFKEGRLQYSSTSFSAADGLCAGQVNSIALYNDTVYAATSTGISLFNTYIRPAIKEVPVYITQIWVNEEAVDMQQSYTLAPLKNNIRIQFSGIDLTGFPPRYQYKINEHAWQNISGNMLSLRELASGRYHILIRALKRNREPSPYTASLMVTIETPFWRNPLFLLMAALFLFGAGFYFLNRRNKLKRAAEIAKLQTDKKLAELELQAIKSNINPHFIFNCLNSIKLLNHQGKKEEVDVYLEKFSALLRSTLDYSTVGKISLRQEVHYIENYLSLEKLRMREKLSYAITVSESIDTDTTFIPAMLLQPYVENAIKHGLRHLQGEKGMITIRFTQEGNTLVCTVEDNGVGRARSAEINGSAPYYHQSKGMDLASRHAHLEGTAITISDKAGAANQPLGTVVTLKIQ